MTRARGPQLGSQLAWLFEYEARTHEPYWVDWRAVRNTKHAARWVYIPKCNNSHSPFMNKLWLIMMLSIITDMEVCPWISFVIIRYQPVLTITHHRSFTLQWLTTISNWIRPFTTIINHWYSPLLVNQPANHQSIQPLHLPTNCWSSHWTGG